MTSSYKYNEPIAVSRDDAMTGVGDQNAFHILSRLVSLIGDGDEENVVTVENSSFLSPWDIDVFMDETSPGPCGISNNASCNNLTDETSYYDGSYNTWQVSIHVLFSVKMFVRVDLQLDNHDETQVKQLLSALDATNLTQHVSLPTHHGLHNLDLVITASFSSLSPINDHSPVSPSDHFLSSLR